MPSEIAADNRVRLFRVQRDWSQAELAQRTGISRTAVSAIEGRRLSPSVNAALALAKVLDCTVEELFGTPSETESESQWAWPPPQATWRYWQAEVAGRSLLYPVDSTATAGGVQHDGVNGSTDGAPAASAIARRTLVLACCDPAAGLLATLYGRITGFRLLVVPRSSRQSLELLAQGRVHVAGIHLSSEQDEDGNAQAVQSMLGDDFKLLRVAAWQEGLAVAGGHAARSVRSVVQSRLRWVGREEGSGARQCLDDVLPRKTAMQLVANDHRGVAEAIRCGWADVGVCLRLTCEEAGLKFLRLRDEYFDCCFPASFENDPRMHALLRVIRMKDYRDMVADLPGYSSINSGEVRSAR